MTTLRDEAIRAAKDALRTTWAETGTLTVPVDPIRVAHRLGLNVYAADLAQDWSGALIKTNEDDEASIYVNRQHSRTRQRFTVAHELGHWFRRVESDDATFEYIDKRDALASAGTDPDEVYANAFAAELLMPADEVRRSAEVVVPALASKFGVSPEAMSNRLRTLGLIHA